MGVRRPLPARRGRGGRQHRRAGLLRLGRGHHPPPPVLDRPLPGRHLHHNRPPPPRLRRPLLLRPPVHPGRARPAHHARLAPGGPDGRGERAGRLVRCDVPAEGRHARHGRRPAPGPGAGADRAAAGARRGGSGTAGRPVHPAARRARGPAGHRDDPASRPRSGRPARAPRDTGRRGTHGRGGEPVARRSERHPPSAPRDQQPRPDGRHRTPVRRAAVGPRRAGSTCGSSSTTPHWRSSPTGGPSPPASTPPARTRPSVSVSVPTAMWPWSGSTPGRWRRP